MTWLRRSTTLLIQAAEDVVLAMKYDLDGIDSSNNGGRNINTLVQSLLSFIVAEYAANLYQVLVLTLMEIR